MADDTTKRRNRPTVQGYLDPAEAVDPTVTEPDAHGFDDEKTVVEAGPGAETEEDGAQTVPRRRFPPPQESKAPATLPAPAQSPGPIAPPALGAFAAPRLPPAPPRPLVPPTNPRLDVPAAARPPTAPPVEAPFVEVVHVTERGSPQLLAGPWRTYEIWTQRSVYALDATLECVEVVNRATGQATTRHKIVGSRLMGGKLRRDGDRRMEVSHPLPRKGANAVFENRVGKRVSFSETSPVTRIVLRLRVVDIAPDEPQPQWEDLTGSHRVPERR